MTTVSRTTAGGGAQRSKEQELTDARAHVKTLMDRAAGVLADRSSSSSADIDTLADDLYRAGSTETRLATLASGFEILGPATPSAEVTQVHERLQAAASIARREERTPPGFE